MAEALPIKLAIAVDTEQYDIVSSLILFFVKLEV